MAETLCVSDGAGRHGPVWTARPWAALGDWRTQAPSVYWRAVKYEDKGHHTSNYAPSVRNGFWCWGEGGLKTRGEKSSSDTSSVSERASGHHSSQEGLSLSSLAWPITAPERRMDGWTGIAAEHGAGT
ncbi:hypothetical protein ACOMHN_038663 [Nucella lapillus]